VVDVGSYPEIGKFIVKFQSVEANLDRIVRLLLRARDSEMVEIVLAPLGYRNKLEVSVALLRRF
jgi:hypothetical protein